LKKYAENLKFIDLSVSINFIPLLMTSQHRFSFGFPEEMVGLIGFLYVRSLLLGKLSKISKNLILKF